MTDFTDVGFDTETFTFEKPDVPVVVNGSFSYDAQKGTLLHPDHIVQLFSIPDLRFIGHNLCAFDFVALFVHHPELRELILDILDQGRAIDTLLGEVLLAYGQGIQTHAKGYLTLAGCLERYGMPPKGDDEWRLRYGELYGVPFEQWPAKAKIYAEHDSVAPMHLWAAQQQQCAAMDYYLPTMTLECQSAFALSIATATGFEVDKAMAQKVIGELDATANTVKAQLVTAGLLRSNGTRDTKALQDLISQLLPNAPKTKTGRVKTDKHTLSNLPNNPTVAAYRVFMKATKRTAFVKDLLKRAPRVHPTYRSMGARSSRTSAADPNIQQIPKEKQIRAILCAGAGKSLVRGDFSTQEMRTFAEACIEIVGFSDISQRLNADPEFDAHEHLAQGVGHGCVRQIAKSGNFAFLGGMGAKGFQKYLRGVGVELPIDQCNVVKQGFLRTWREAPKFFDYVKSITSQGARLPVTLPISGYRRGDCYFTDACNLHFQALAAHASKLALWEVTKLCFDRRIASPLLGCIPNLFIHDEVGVLAPWPHDSIEALSAARALENAMVVGHMRVTPRTPAKVEAETGYSWGG